MRNETNEENQEQHLNISTSIDENSRARFFFFLIRTSAIGTEAKAQFTLGSLVVCTSRSSNTNQFQFNDHMAFKIIKRKIFSVWRSKATAASENENAITHPFQCDFAPSFSMWWRWQRHSMPSKFGFIFGEADSYVNRKSGARSPTHTHTRACDKCPIYFWNGCFLAAGFTAKALKGVSVDPNSTISFETFSQNWKIFHVLTLIFQSNKSFRISLCSNVHVRSFTYILFIFQYLVDAKNSNWHRNKTNELYTKGVEMDEEEGGEKEKLDYNVSIH